MAKGWKGDSHRHSLAARGVKSRGKKKREQRTHNPPAGTIFSPPEVRVSSYRKPVPQEIQLAGWKTGVSEVLIDTIRKEFPRAYITPEGNIEFNRGNNLFIKNDADGNLILTLRADNEVTGTKITHLSELAEYVKQEKQNYPHGRV